MLVFRRTVVLLAALCGLALAGCGGGGHHATRPVCPQAAGGHGALGVCAPKQRLRLTGPHLTPAGPLYPDRSNNNPCGVCGPAIRAAGQVGLIVKVNQGTGFIDQTAAAMVQSARAEGLPVGGYDFDSTYTVAEAQVFAARLHALGIDPRTTNTFPAYLDVEFGAFNYAGLQAQIAYLRGLGYRVGIYTGQWYWGPHAGCRWPAGVSAWLSGYPNAPVPCGTTGYVAHQFTATPLDMTVFLGSLAAFHQFVNAPVPPKPPPPPKPTPIDYRVNYKAMWPVERYWVLRYDGARKHPARYAGYLKGTLEPRLRVLAGALYVAAHRHRPPNWSHIVAGHGSLTRGQRYQLIAQRAQGRQVAR